MMWFFGHKKDISNMVFDWDAYYADIENKIGFDEQDKKMRNLEYYVPALTNDIPVASYARR